MCKRNIHRALGCEYPRAVPGALRRPCQGWNQNSNAVRKGFLGLFLARFWDGTQTLPILLAGRIRNAMPDARCVHSSEQAKQVPTDLDDQRSPPKPCGKFAERIQLVGVAGGDSRPGPAGPDEGTPSNVRDQQRSLHNSQPGRI